MLIGYARVSKGDDQSTSAQLRALKDAGCERLFEEAASGGRWDRPQLLRMIDHLRPGDVVVTWKLDRLSRSLKDLIHILEKIEATGAGFRSLTEAIDTTTSAGRMMMQRAAQLHAEARGGEELTSALAEYLGPVLNRRGVPNALTRRLRPDRTVVFNTEEPGAFPFGAASLLNQVMAFALLAATADSGVVRRSHGRVTDVRRESDGRYSVEGPTLDGRRFAELFDRVWLRHGPDRGARYEPFEPYYTSYRDEHRRRVTREPRLSAPPRLHPETFEFFDAPYDSLFDHATQGARRVHREVRSRTISIALDPATGALAQRGPRAVAELAAELDALDRAYTIQLCVQPGQCDGLAPELVRLAKMSGEKVRLTTLPAHLPAWRALHPPADALQELLDTPFAPADAPAAGVITRLLDSAVLRPIEVITEAEAEQALSEEAAVESERMKGLLLRFWDLPASERRNIALRLSLLEEGDRRHANAITALHTHAQVQDEELQALWWLVGGVSWEFARPIDQLDPKLKSLAVATELASLTALLPGISALAALLSRAGLSDSETLAVSDVVGSSDQAWLRSTAEELQPSPVVHPLHFAVLRSLETDGGDAWVTGWAAATEFPQDVALSQAAMATQFYRERLLLRPQG